MITDVWTRVHMWMQAQVFRMSMDRCGRNFEV